MSARGFTCETSNIPMQSSDSNRIVTFGCFSIFTSAVKEIQGSIVPDFRKIIYERLKEIDEELRAEKPYILILFRSKSIRYFKSGIQKFQITLKVLNILKSLAATPLEAMSKLLFRAPKPSKTLKCSSVSLFKYF